MKPALILIQMLRTTTSPAAGWEAGGAAPWRPACRRRKLLEAHFAPKGLPLVHIQSIASNRPGASFFPARSPRREHQHANVDAPRVHGETRSCRKHFPNSFRRNEGLLEHLRGPGRRPPGHRRHDDLHVA